MSDTMKWRTRRMYGSVRYGGTGSRGEGSICLFIAPRLVAIIGTTSRGNPSLSGALRGSGWRGRAAMLGAAPLAFGATVAVRNAAALDATERRGTAAAALDTDPPTR